MNHLGLERYTDLDSHTVIDVCGVGLKYLTRMKKGTCQIELQKSDQDGQYEYEYGFNILRGIEVKVSRSDFRNGFMCSGCNYHYLLTPMRLVAPYEVPKGVGLIEYNRYKFSCELNEEESDMPSKRPFRIGGLRVVKHPVFRNIPQFQIDNAIERISSNLREHSLEEILQEIAIEA